MAATPRFLVDNLAHDAVSVLTASSENASSPVENLTDQLRSKTWRSASGVWVVTAGINDKIDFNRGGVKAATLTAGTYVSSSSYAGAVVAAMETADSTPVWATAYSSGKYTISADSTFTLLSNSGTNLATAAWKDLGYGTSADTTAGPSQLALNSVYQGQHWIKVALSSAQAVQAGVLLEHNLNSNGSITLKGSTSDGFSVASVSQAMVINSDGDLSSAWLTAEQTYRYWMVQIDNCRSSDGYTEAGVVFVGPRVQPAKAYSIGFSTARESLRQITRTVGGAVWVNENPEYDTWNLSWKVLSSTQKSVLDTALNLVPVGECFFFAPDATADATDVRYVFREESAPVGNPKGSLYSISLRLLEAVN